MSASNPKARTWDAIGLKCYFLGRRGGKPAAGTIRWFTRDLARDSRCMVVGGTSVAVIRAALVTGCLQESTSRPGSAPSSAAGCPTR
jgi:hypothetical protein